MKKSLLLPALFFFAYSTCMATIRRVGYPGTYRAGVDYATLTEANNAAANNDTIQIYGTIGGGDITKPLVIMGFGYNFDANQNLQAIGTDAPSYSNSYIYFRKGSSGSTITGIDANIAINDNSGTHALISNITIQRCEGSFYTQNNSGYGPISDIKIISSVIHDGGMQWNAANDYPVTNLQVYNSIIYSYSLNKTGSSASFINCTFWYSPDLNDAGVLVKNCIYRGSNNVASNTNTVYENTFFPFANPGNVTGSNNRWSQDWAAIFTRNGRTDDVAGYYYNAEFDEDYYMLKVGSPAINGGFNAAGQPTDCGIYGGEAAYKYKLSGVPAVPAIYKLTAPSLSASANPYNVTISVRSNN